MALSPGVPDPPANTKVLPEPSSRHLADRMPFEPHQSLAGFITNIRRRVIGLLRTTALNDRVAMHIADKASEAVVGPGQ
jgi:hypothetical protein